MALNAPFTTAIIKSELGLPFVKDLGLFVPEQILFY
jgi:hypothetical protein